MGEFGIGQSVPREEDPYLVRGAGRYVDDVTVTGQLRGFVLRSPHAHARIRSIDIDAARSMPGVHLVLTGRDASHHGFGNPAATGPAQTARWQPCGPCITTRTRTRHRPSCRRSGRFCRGRDIASGEGRRRGDRSRLRAAPRRRDSRGGDQARCTWCARDLSKQSDLSLRGRRQGRCRSRLCGGGACGRSIAW